jgi:hypothetical protein
LGFSLSFPHFSLLITSCESRLHKLALFIPLYFKFVLSPLASKWVFLWCYWGLNSVPCTCWAGTLPLEPHCWLRMGLCKAQSIFTPSPDQRPLHFLLMILLMGISWQVPSHSSVWTMQSSKPSMCIPS